MKRTHRLFFALFVGLAAGLAALAVAQTRRDDFDATGVVVTEGHLTALPDGGCAMRWWGFVDSADGGVELTAYTDVVELRGATNQNRCAQLLSAGIGRVSRAMRFDADAGAP